MKLPDLSMAAIECAARMKSVYDSEGRTEIYKSEVDVSDPSVYAELKRVHIIRDHSDSSFVVFQPEAYASVLTVR